MPASPEILESLARDIALEHAAILQYIVQGRQLRDSPLANDVMEMAREEMWHMEWLIEAIRDRGGVPTVDRGDVFVSATLLDGMQADIRAEQTALDHYVVTLGVIADTDPELRMLIERIVDDERHHRVAFTRLAQRVAADGEGAHAPAPAIGPEDIPHVGPIVALEYEGLLRHLWSKYGCGDCEQAEQYFELAIDEMRHVAWAAGFVVGLGTPTQQEILTDRVVPVASREAALAQSEKFEGRAADTYHLLAPGAADPALKGTLERAERRHAFNRHLLERMRES
jgi:rubrerythrin